MELKKRVILMTREGTKMRVDIQKYVDMMIRVDTKKQKDFQR